MRKSAYLITEEMFREVSPLPGTFDWNYLKPHILRAQDIHIQPLLGSKLFYDLQVKLYDDTLTADDAELLDDYIAKALVYSVLADPYCFNVKVENSGIVTKDLGDSRSITFEDAKKLSEQMRSHADFYKQRLIDYLLANTAKFQLYLVAEAPDMAANSDALPDFMNFDSDYQQAATSSSAGGGTGGTTEHDKLTEASRALANQHPIGAITLLREELDALQLGIDQEASARQQADQLESNNRVAGDASLAAAISDEAFVRAAGDTNLQQQIFQIVENSLIDIVRFFNRNQTTLSGQTVYLSSETKGTNAAFNITQNVTGTNRATANVIAKFAGDTPLTVERELPAQNTSLFLRLNKNNTNRNVFVFVEFYDYSGAGVLTLKGTTSDFEIRSDVDVYNLLLQIEAYIAQIGARSWIEIKSYQTGSGVAAQTTLGIEGDYYSRFQYRIPAGALSFLDDKVISTQDLPNLASLSGEDLKQILLKLDNFLGGTLNTSEIDDTGWLTSEQRLAVLEKTLSGIQIKGAALLLDIFAPPGVEASLRDNTGWTNETKTLTGDNSTGQLGQKGAHIWLNDAVYAECVSSVLAVSGSATYKRNRAVDVLYPVNNTQDAAIANQLDPSYTYPAMTPTGNSTDQGWNLTSQVKVITNLPTRWGMWFIGGINGDGYTYFCFLVNGNTSYWKRNGTPSSIQRPIYAATHPTLTGRLLAHDFSTSAYVTQAGDEVSYADQTFYDAATRGYFIKMINGNWEKIR